MEPRVVLLGLMGSGKTTIGKAIEQLTGWPYIDNDAALFMAHGVGLRELAERGADELHELEVEALATGLRERPPCILGAAAAVVDLPRGMDLLRSADAVVVQLRARAETLVERIQGTDRPWLEGDLLATLQGMKRHREPHYTEVADIVVDVDTATPEEIATEIVSRVRRVST